MLNPFLSFFSEAVLYSKPKTLSNNNLSSIAFAGYAVSYTIVETPFLLAGGSPGFNSQDIQDICVQPCAFQLYSSQLSFIILSRAQSEKTMKRYYLMMEHGMDIRHLPNRAWMSMIFDAPRVTVSVAPAMIIVVTESVVLMAKQDQSCSTV